MTPDNIKEFAPALNAIYANENLHIQENELNEKFQYAVDTAKIITDRLIIKAQEKAKIKGQILSLETKIKQKKNEFVDKFSKSIIVKLFGKLFGLRKSQMNMFEPPKQKQYVRKVVVRPELKFERKGDMQLLPSKKNPKVKRWQRTNSENSVGQQQSLNLFETDEKKSTLNDKVADNDKIIEYTDFFQTIENNDYRIKITDFKKAAGLFGYMQTDEPMILVVGLSAANTPTIFTTLQIGESDTINEDLIKDLNKRLINSNSRNFIVLEKVNKFVYSKSSLKMQKIKEKCVASYLDYLVKDNAGDIYSHQSENRVLADNTIELPGKINKEKAIYKIHPQKMKTDLNKIKVRDQRDLTPIFEVMSNWDREKFVVLNLDNEDNVKSMNIAHIGGLSESIVSKETVFKTTIDDKCDKAIVLHNHPSENLLPSQEDKIITNNLVEYANKLGIDLIDHIVVASKNKFYSIIGDYEHEIKKAFSRFKSLTLKKSRKLHNKYFFQRLPISIENKKGSVRRGTDQDGHEWAIRMHYDYGYIRLTEASDGEHLDCYVGPDKKADHVYVIHQNDPFTGKYDEDKVMLGFNSADEAKKAFLKHYDRDGFFGSMSVLPIDVFKRFLDKKKNKGKPVVFDPKNVRKSHVIFNGRTYSIRIKDLC